MFRFTLGRISKSSWWRHPRIVVFRCGLVVNSSRHCILWVSWVIVLTVVHSISVPLRNEGMIHKLQININHARLQQVKQFLDFSLAHPIYKVGHAKYDLSLNKKYQPRFSSNFSYRIKGYIVIRFIFKLRLRGRVGAYYPQVEHDRKESKPGIHEATTQPQYEDSRKTITVVSSGIGMETRFRAMLRHQ